MATAWPAQTRATESAIRAKFAQAFNQQ